MFKNSLASKTSTTLSSFWKHNLSSEYCDATKKYPGLKDIRPIVQRLCFKKKFIPPTAHSYFNTLFNLTNFAFSSSYKIKVQQIPDKKICEFNFKLLSNILACRKKLYKWQATESANCMLCNSEETVEHLLYYCPAKLKIWNLVCSVLNIKCHVKVLVLGSSDFILDWTISVVTYCLYKYWIWSNDAKSNEVTNVTCIRRLNQNLKNYITIYKLCNFDEGVSKRLELIFGALSTM